MLPPLEQAQTRSIAARKDHIGKEQERPILHPDTSISFLLGLFIYMDIVSCASTRSSQLLTVNHKLLLDSDEINLADLTGCRNWVMVLIFEISFLDNWKRKEERAHRLSLVEFTKRGRQIEECLLGRLASLEDARSTRAPASGYLPSDYSITEITRIFALSAITYLHVVISGAYPEIPDIKESVSKTLDALQSLSDSKLLQHVVWPYCISGCLAVEEQEQKFRALMSSPHVTHRTCLDALNIMEECWRLRETERPNHDWTYIMKKDGQHILLV